MYLFVYVGHYIIVEAATGMFYSRAHIETPVFGATGPSCQMQFYYHMFGVNAGMEIFYCKMKYLYFMLP